MVRTDDRFAARSPEDVLRLVESNPLAWVVSHGKDGPHCTPLPIRPVIDANGRITHLLGHFARNNPHVELLRRNRRALMLFLGPHGYVSPSWMQDRTQAPTWNYASAQFIVDLRFFEDAARLEALMRDLIGAVEAGRPNAWTLEDMGERYASLSRRVIGFEATVLTERSKFKLGQDERDDTYPEILQGLGESGNDDLIAWMERFNKSRPPT